MGKFNSNYVTCLSISLFFFACIRTTSSDRTPDICSNKNCGQGICKASATSPIGFECQCNPGWTRIRIAFITIPSCIVPNCTINFNCGSPSPTPPPGFVLPTPQINNFSSPCALVWCGEGNCVANGAASTCQCNKDATNLINMPALPCFKECFLGADCNNLGFGPLPNPTLLPPPPPQQSPCSESAASGASGDWNWMKNIDSFMMIVLATSLLTWFL